MVSHGEPWWGNAKHCLVASTPPPAASERRAIHGAMSFGRNPHVAKAEAAEQKARGAKDVAASSHAWREAGRLWERAADRETDAKRRVTYTANAERARASADDPHATTSVEEDAPSAPTN
jgi:hypothetical protein